MRIDQVFGISPEVREYSYVDRGNLDDTMRRMLGRTTHIAVRGPSKSGKSWLRQKVLSEPITVQCRLRKPFTDIYVDALSQLDIAIQVKESRQGVFKASVSASGEGGSVLLAKVGITGSIGKDTTNSTEAKVAGHDVNDLRFVADILHASGRRLVIEDFHYMSTEDRRSFAFDLKALWDYGVFVIIIGVWSLTRILTKGGSALGVDIDPKMQDKLVELSYANAGLLQQLTLLTLDDAGLQESGIFNKRAEGLDHVDNASMAYAEQLNPVYQQFAKRVAAGMRTRKNATGIYAHAMAVIMDASDDELIKGLHARQIFDRAVKRQPRVQYGNLKAILEKLPELQVDEDGRGLILGYSPATEEITIVDRQLLLYRLFSTVKWPWEDVIREADAQGGQLEAGND